MAKIIDSTNLGYLISKIKAAFWGKSETTQVSIDDTPTANSNNLVKSGGVKSYVDSAIPSDIVQDVTVGGTTVVDSSGTAVIPAIPTDAVKYTSQSLTTAQKTQARTNIGAGTGTYSKPSGGIPASDLASGVIPTVGTLNTANASAQTTSSSESLSGTVNLHKISKTGAFSDLLNVPAFVTAEEQSGSDFPIIGDPSNYYTKAETDAVAELPKVTEDPEGGFVPNVYYAIGSIAGSKTFTLDTSQEKTGIANIYYWTFTTSTPAPTITWPSQITSWYGGAPTIKANTHYEISVLDGVAICVEV